MNRALRAVGVIVGVGVCALAMALSLSVAKPGVAHAASYPAEFYVTTNSESPIWTHCLCPNGSQLYKNINPGQLVNTAPALGYSVNEMYVGAGWCVDYWFNTNPGVHHYAVGPTWVNVLKGVYDTRYRTSAQAWEGCWG